MAFVDITDRLAEILETRKADLVSSLRDANLVIEKRFPDEHVANQVVFIWRDSVGELEYGGMVGEGTNTTGEIDGLGTWNVAFYERFPGRESIAADQLSRLAWNFLTVMADYRTDADNTYVSAMVTASTADTLAATNAAWYLGERFNLRIRWSLIVT